MLALGDQAAATHLGHVDEGLLAALAVDVAEAGIPVFQAAHFFELLFNPATHFQRVFDVFGQLGLGDFTVGMEEFDEAGDDLADGFLVTPAKVATELEMTLGIVGVARLANLAENLGEKVGY